MSNRKRIDDYKLSQFINKFIDSKFVTILGNNRNRDLVTNINGVSVKCIGKGGQGSVYLLKNNEIGSIVLKISQPSTGLQYNNEKYIVSDVKKIIEKNICPNFIYYYKHLFKEYHDLIFSEYIDGTLEQWLMTKHTQEEWESMLFQILYGILVVQKKLSGYHGDMKPKNLFYKKVATSVSNIYAINEVTYQVPLEGHLFMIGDFGKIQSLKFEPEYNNLNSESIKLHLKNNSDLYEIINLPKRIMTVNLESDIGYDEIISIIKSKNDPYFNQYLVNQRNDVEATMSKYPEHIKKKMLHKKLIYYAIEKNYIKYQEKESAKSYLPPTEILKLLEKISEQDLVSQMLLLFKKYTRPGLCAYHINFND